MIGRLSLWMMVALASILSMQAQSITGIVKAGSYENLNTQPGSETLRGPSSLPSEMFGAWKSSRFWDLPVSESSPLEFPDPKGWKKNERVGDTMRKRDEMRFRVSSDIASFFCIRFDMRRVITNRPSGNNFPLRDGYLTDALYNQMRSYRGKPLISEKAKIKVLATFKFGEMKNMEFYNGQPFRISVVQFNDFKLDKYEDLTAYIGQNKLIEFEIPIEYLRWPDPASHGEEPTPAWNMIVLRSDIGMQKIPNSKKRMFDEHNLNFRIDAEISYQAVAPIILIHGTDAQSDTWESPKGDSFVDFFEGTGVGNKEEPYPGPWSRDINLGKETHGNDGIDESAAQLLCQTSDILTRFGAKYCHWVGHSKGGSDGRTALAKLKQIEADMKLHLPPPPDPIWDKKPLKTRFKALSLFTLGTPHLGTILSDTGFANEIILWTPWTNKANDSFVQTVFNFDLFGRMGGGTTEDLNPVRGSALRDQRPSEMFKRWNDDLTAHHLTDQKGNIHFYSVSSDADVDRNYQIDWRECEHLMPYSNLIPLANAMYHTIGNYSTIKPIAVKKTYIIYTLQKAEVFMPNDLVGPAPYAIGPNANHLKVEPFALPKDPYKYPHYMGANHSGLKNTETAKKVLETIFADFPDFNYTYPE